MKLPQDWAQRSPSATASEWVRSRPRTTALYGLFVVMCLCVYRNLEAKETGKHDFVLTLSAGLQVLAFSLLVWDTRSQVAEGLSERSLWAFFIAHLTRLTTTFWGQGYVPEDNTSSVYLYQLLELFGVLLISFKLLKVTTMRSVHDVGHNVEKWNMLTGILVASFILAFFTKSDGHDDYFADLSWMFSVWVDALALAPQVQLLWTSSYVDESQLHFATVTLLAGITFGGFWFKIAIEHHETDSKSDGKDNINHFLFGIFFAAVCRVCLCITYFVLFVKNSKAFKGVLAPKNDYEICAQDEEL